MLARSVRETDLAVRFGGEEFVDRPAGRAARATRAAPPTRSGPRSPGSRSQAPRGEVVSVTASFGVAEFPTYATPEALLAAADAALYQAKRAGKNRVATSTVHDDDGLDEGAGIPAILL